MLSPNTSCGTPATLRQAVRGVYLGYIAPRALGELTGPCRSLVAYRR